MRVVFNTLSTLKPKTGVGHYAARLAEALALLTGPGQIETFPGPVGRSLARRTLRSSNPIVANEAMRWSRVRSAAKMLGRQMIGRWFHATCRPGRFDLYHEPNFLPLPSALPTIITVHDLSVILHPEWHPADRVQRHEQLFRSAVERCSHVITVSKSVRREAIEYLGLSPENVTSVHNGIGPEFHAASREDAIDARRRLQLPDSYLLYVGTIEPRKNLDTLLTAYCDLPEAVRESCPLVLAGGWGWKAEPVRDYYETIARHRYVRHLGYVADMDRPGLYAGARALVFPSHYEGFGLPPLEMLAVGGAVLASTSEAHREVLDGHAHFTDAGDWSGWRSILLRAILDDDWLGVIRRGGRAHAAQFTWHRSACETLAVYRSTRGERRAA